MIIVNCSFLPVIELNIHPYMLPWGLLVQLVRKASGHIIDFGCSHVASGKLMDVTTHPG